MNRRTFVAFLATSIIAPRSLQQASPAASDQPGPIDLGSGITLRDYRLYPGEPPAIIGEIRNETDRMIDAPVISLTWPRDGQHDGFTWAAPMLPVFGPGESTGIFGVLPAGENSGTVIATSRFALCSPAEPGMYAAQEAQLHLNLEVIQEDYYEDARYRCEASLTNLGTETASDTMVRGIVRDRDGRIAGTTSSPFTSTIGARETKIFTLWGGGDVNNKANPTALISGRDYTVELVAGTRGPVVSPGCTFGFPWS